MRSVINELAKGVVDNPDFQELGYEANLCTDTVSIKWIDGNSSFPIPN